MKPNIYRLYIIESLTMEDMMEIMRLVHFFDKRKLYEMMLETFQRLKAIRTSNYEKWLRNWGFIKNDGTKNKNRNRKRKFAESELVNGQEIVALYNIPWINLTFKDIDYPTIPQYPRPLAILEQQEKILISIQSYIYGLFDSHGWTPGTFRPSPPAGSPNRRYSWKIVSDQCFSAKLAFSVSNQKGNSALKSVRANLESLSSSRDLYAMVKLWRVCLYLHHIGASFGSQWILKSVLDHFKECVSKNQPQDMPLVTLLDGLCKICEFDEKMILDTLRMCYIRSLHCLGEIMGTGHLMILSMWPPYIKQWQTRDAYKSILRNHYQSGLAAIDAEFGPQSDEAVVVLHDFLYYLYYCHSKRDPQCRVLAVELHDRAAQLIRNRSDVPQWTSQTQYFVFATQILAQNAKKAGNIASTRNYIIDAVTLLKDGDYQCRIHAHMLLGTLQKCLKRYDGDLGTEEISRKRQELAETLLKSDNVVLR